MSFNPLYCTVDKPVCCPRSFLFKPEFTRTFTGNPKHFGVRDEIRQRFHAFLRKRSKSMDSRSFWYFFGLILFSILRVSLLRRHWNVPVVRRFASAIFYVSPPPTASTAQIATAFRPLPCALLHQPLHPHPYKRDAPNATSPCPTARTSPATRCQNRL